MDILGFAFPPTFRLEYFLNEILLQKIKSQEIISRTTDDIYEHMNFLNN